VFRPIKEMLDNKTHRHEVGKRIKLVIKIAIRNCKFIKRIIIFLCAYPVQYKKLNILGKREKV